MSFDFSILKDIDLTQKENILFIVIFLVVVIAVFLIIVFLLAEAIKIIKMIARKISVKFFDKEVRRPSFENPSVAGGVPKPNRTAGNLVAEEKEIIKKQVFSEPSYSKTIKKSEEDIKEPEEKYEEDIKKNIEKSFAGLKSSNGENSLTSKMPSTAKSYTLGQENYKSDNLEQPSVKHPLNSKVVSGGLDSGQDNSIFRGAEEISRSELKNKLKTDDRVWQKAKGEGLEMSPLERANLVKEVFSSDLGANISKSDMRTGIKRLNQKLSNTKDPKEHAKLRREIQFFKKIEGV